MCDVRRMLGAAFPWPILGAATVVASVALQAQPRVPEDHSAYVGGWTLNRELSSTPPAPDGPDGGGREGRGGRGRGGPPIGGLVAQAVAEASAVRAEQEGLAMHHRSIQRKWKR